MRFAKSDVPLTMSLPGVVPTPAVVAGMTQSPVDQGPGVTIAQQPERPQPTNFAECVAGIGMDQSTAMVWAHYLGESAATLDEVGFRSALVDRMRQENVAPPVRKALLRRSLHVYHRQPAPRRTPYAGWGAMHKGAAPRGYPALGASGRLAKSGEGSRGGHITGHTRSGRPIYGAAASPHAQGTAGHAQDTASPHSLPLFSFQGETRSGKRFNSAAHMTEHRYASAAKAAEIHDGIDRLKYDNERKAAREAHGHLALSMRAVAAHHKDFTAEDHRDAAAHHAAKGKEAEHAYFGEGPDGNSHAAYDKMLHHSGATMVHQALAEKMEAKRAARKSLQTRPVLRKGVQERYRCCARAVRKATSQPDGLPLLDMGPLVGEYGAEMLGQVLYDEIDAGALSFDGSTFVNMDQGMRPTLLDDEAAEWASLPPLPGQSPLGADAATLVARI